MQRIVISSKSISVAWNGRPGRIFRAESPAQRICILDIVLSEGDPELCELAQTHRNAQVQNMTGIDPEGISELLAIA